MGGTAEKSENMILGRMGRGKVGAASLRGIFRGRTEQTNFTKEGIEPKGRRNLFSLGNISRLMKKKGGPSSAWQHKPPNHNKNNGE